MCSDVVWITENKKRKRERKKKIKVGLTDKVSYRADIQ